MSTLDTVAIVVHQLFGGLWIGAVVFVGLAVVPLGRDADIDPDALGTVVGRLLTLSRAAAVLMLLSGAHVLYYLTLGEDLDLGPLLESGRGHLILTMVVLWLGVIATVEVGASRLRAGLDADKLRDPTRSALPFFRAAALLGLAVLTVGGMLTAGVGT